MAEIKKEQVFATLKPSDLSDPTLFKVNNMLNFLASQIDLLQRRVDELEKIKTAPAADLGSHPDIKAIQTVVQNVDHLSVTNNQNITNLTTITNVTNLVGQQTIVYNNITNTFESADGISISFNVVVGIATISSVIEYLDHSSNPQTGTFLSSIIPGYQGLTFIKGVLS